MTLHCCFLYCCGGYGYDFSLFTQIFWKARARAKEDLNEQLADFQQKRTAGLGTLFGPPDTDLDECIHDKTKEVKTVEKILLPKLEPFM